MGAFLILFGSNQTPTTQYRVHFAGTDLRERSQPRWQKLLGQLPGVCRAFVIANQYGGPRYAPAPSPAGPSSSATPSAGAAPVGFSVCGEDGQEREAAGEAEGPSMSRLVMPPQLVDAALNQR